MEKGLPEIEIEGTKYVFDINELALIQKDSNREPSLFFNQMNDCGTHYEFVYNKDYKCLDQYGMQNGIDTHRAGNHRLVEVKIPQMGKIDPIGMSEKYGCTLNEVRQKSDFEIMVNQQAYDLRVNKGMLPTIDIRGHTFYVDIRMDKLRPKDDFLSNGISISEIDVYFYDTEGKYIIPYNPQKKELGKIDYENITEIPKDLVVVEIPSILKMDAVGYNRRYGNDIKCGLKEMGLQMNFTDKPAKWEDIYVPQKIKENLQEIEKSKKVFQHNNSVIKPHKPERKKGRTM